MPSLPSAGGSTARSGHIGGAVRLRDIGLDEKDAHHVMLAIESQCDWFVTCDEATILNRNAGAVKAAIETEFPPIKLMLPSALVSSGLLGPPIAQNGSP
jgi:predicted nucleic acid-binding protein